MIKKTNQANPSPDFVNEESFERMRLPREKDLEQLAMVMQLMGSNQVKVLCMDGTERQVRIPGKLQKKVWLRENDIVIIKLWDFQPSKGDVVWRYLGNQVSWLKRRNFLNKFPI
ncbi:MAG: translation initiation factor eIF-1A [Candidatus ainarchaeum sp.]|nr:translation initiation factor eIF-1A [Candidatus ainarchaeum sp.]